MTSVTSSDVAISLFINKSEVGTFSTLHTELTSRSQEIFDYFTNYIVIFILRHSPYSPLLLQFNPARSLTFHVLMLLY